MSISWQVVGQSVRGATHERNGLPNQDAIYWLPESGRGPSRSRPWPMVTAVRVIREVTSARPRGPNRGALVDEFLQSQADDNLSLIKHATEEWLPRALVRNWSAVTDHLNSEPLTPDEPASLDADPAVAYGATLLVTVVTERFVLYLQLGDGEILSVSESGEVVRPLTKDDRLFGNETTSLCAPEAWRDFRVNFQPLTQSRPALILVSTDGYPNSFRDESGFMKVGSDLLSMIRENGLASVNDQLAGWLRDSTHAGSGDDVTLGILCSLDN